MCDPARHASHDCKSCEPRWRVNMRISQLLKANRFKMGALTQRYMKWCLDLNAKFAWLADCPAP